MYPNAPIANILDSSSSTYANFDGAGGSPWWVIFDLATSGQLSELQMKPYVAAESPKTMTVGISSSPGGPWSLIGTLSTPNPWDGPQSFLLSVQSAGRYVQLSVTTTHNGAAPTIQYVEFYGLPGHPPLPLHPNW